MESQTRISEFRQSYQRLNREYPVNPKLVYLASCYRSARGEYGVKEHIESAAQMARAIWKLGLAVICPAMNTAFFSGIDVPDTFWLTGDFVMVRRCDGIVMHPNWEESTGAQAELVEARLHGLPIFFIDEGYKGDWKKLAAWAKKPADITHSSTERGLAPETPLEQLEALEIKGE